MKKIWIIYDDSDYECRYVERVFTDEEKADEFIKFFNPNNDFTKEEFCIDAPMPEYECKKKFFSFRYDGFCNYGRKDFVLKSSEEYFGYNNNQPKPRLNVNIRNSHICESYLVAEFVIEVDLNSNIDIGREEVLKLFNTLDETIKKMKKVGFSDEQISEKLRYMVEEEWESLKCKLLIL